jgi:hypothetical protein
MQESTVLADDQSKFIYEELLPGTIKRICSIITKNVPYALLIASTIECVVTLFNSMLKMDGTTSNQRIVDMADLMRIVFDSQ